MSYNIIFICFMRRCDWSVLYILSTQIWLDWQNKQKANEPKQKYMYVSMDTRSNWTL